MTYNKQQANLNFWPVVYEKNVVMENYLPKWGLQIVGKTFFDKTNFDKISN